VLHDANALSGEDFLKDSGGAEAIDPPRAAGGAEGKQSNHRSALWRTQAIDRDLLGRSRSSVAQEVDGSRVTGRCCGGDS
jgi:hypothetical protein